MKNRKITSLCFLELATPKSAARTRGERIDSRILVTGHKCGTINFFSSSGKLLLSPLLHDTAVLQLKVKSYPYSTSKHLEKKVFFSEKNSEIEYVKKKQGGGR